MRDELGRYVQREAVICPHCGEPMPGPEPEEVLELGDVRLDVPRRELTVAGKVQDIYRQQGAHRGPGRPQALRMLALMLRRPGTVWHVERLMTGLGLWDAQSEIIRVYVYAVRQAIKDSRNVRLKTVPGGGGFYTLELVEETET